jgi:hypothetical protein
VRPQRIRHDEYLLILVSSSLVFLLSFCIFMVFCRGPHRVGVGGAAGAAPPPRLPPASERPGAGRRLRRLRGPRPLAHHCSSLHRFVRIYISRVSSHLLLSTLIPLSEVGTTCLHHVVKKIRHLFLRPAACLSSTLLETEVDANDCKCSRDLQLNVPSEARRSSR